MANISQQYNNIDELMFDIKDVIRARERELGHNNDPELVDQLNFFRTELALIEQLI